MELRKKLDLTPSLYATMSSLRADTRAAPDLGDINCREVYSAARRLGLVHTAGALLAETCPHTDRSTFQAYSEVAETALRIQNAAWLEVRTSLASADIEPAALKGIYFHTRFTSRAQAIHGWTLEFGKLDSEVRHVQSFCHHTHLALSGSCPCARVLGPSAD